MRITLKSTAYRLTALKGIIRLFESGRIGQEKAYVRVVDGEEQSVSRFDVGGKDIQKGLKGFIYGERGVWRPGDTLHIPRLEAKTLQAAARSESI